MAAQNKITVRFEAIGAPALKDAIEQLRLSQIKLEKGARAHAKAVRKLNKEQGKQTKASVLGVKNNRLLSNSFATLRSKMLLASFAASIVAATIGKVFKAASEQQQAEIKLSSALGRTSQALLDKASAMQQVTRFGDELTISAMSNIAAFIKDEDVIISLTEATADLAAAKGMDLAAAADLVAKSVGSSTNALSRYGIAADGAAKSTERAQSIVKNISVLYGGQAQAQADSYAGTIDGMKNAIGDAAEAIGELLAPAVIVFARLIKETANAIESITDKLAGLSQATFNYFFGLTNLKDATVDYSESLKDFQNNLADLPFSELQAKISTLEPMIKTTNDTTKETSAVFKDTSVVFKEYSDDLRDIVPAFTTTIESTGQLNTSGEELKSTTEEIANATKTLTHMQDMYNLTQKETARRQAFASELYAKTSESQKAATESLIEWVKNNKEAFKTVKEYIAVLKMLEDQLDKINKSTKKLSKEAEAMLDASFDTLTAFVEYQAQIIDDQMARAEEVKQKNIADAKEISKAEMDAVKNSSKYKRAQKRGDYDTMKKLEEEQAKENKKREDDAAKANLAKRIELFNSKQDAARAGVWINSAEALIKIWATWAAQPWMAAGLTALLGVQTGLAISTINRQTAPTMAQGGLIGGRRHSQGGTLIEAERGEFVMNRNAVNAVGLEGMNRINRGQGASNVNIVFESPIMTDEYTEEVIIPQIKESIRRGADIGIS